MTYEHAHTEKGSYKAKVKVDDLILSVGKKKIIAESHSNNEKSINPSITIPKINNDNEGFN